jgi:hypothetical protein
MADRVLVISWGETVHGREERAIEVFNDALGLCGRLQQDGKIEGFDVVLLDPAGDTAGYVVIQGSADQINALDDNEEFTRNTIDASLIVKNLRHTRGYTNEGVASQMALYQEAVGKVPQAS